MKKIKFVEDNPLDYALLKNKIYQPIHEGKENYLVPNEVGGNSTVPKNKFEIVKEDSAPDKPSAIATLYELTSIVESWLRMIK